MVMDIRHLRDEAGDSEDWASAEIRTGALHLALPASRVSLPSPFDYATQTRIFVVNDVRRDSPDQIGAAYRELFLAAGGGALGLFTAISRLRQVHQRLAEPLDRAGLALCAQHVDEIDIARAEEAMRRAEERIRMLGTDIDLERALHSQRRATIRLKVARRRRGMGVPSVRE